MAGTFSCIDHSSPTHVEKIEVEHNYSTPRHEGISDEGRLIEILSKKDFQVNVSVPEISLPTPVVNVEVKASPAQVHVEPACPYVQIPPAQIRIVERDKPRLLLIALIPSLVTLVDIILRIIE